MNIAISKKFGNDKLNKQPERKIGEKVEKKYLKKKKSKK